MTSPSPSAPTGREALAKIIHRRTLCGDGWNECSAEPDYAHCFQAADGILSDGWHPPSPGTDDALAERLRTAQRGMRDRAKAAREASHDPLHVAAVAALRGKATAYAECADMVEAILRGGHIRAKWRSAPSASSPEGSGQ